MFLKRLISLLKKLINNCLKKIRYSISGKNSIDVNAMPESLSICVCNFTNVFLKKPKLFFACIVDIFFHYSFNAGFYGCVLKGRQGF